MMSSRSAMNAPTAKPAPNAVSLRVLQVIVRVPFMAQVDVTLTSSAAVRSGDVPTRMMVTVDPTALREMTPRPTRGAADRGELHRCVL